MSQNKEREFTIEFQKKYIYVWPGEEIQSGIYDDPTKVIVVSEIMSQFSGILHFSKRFGIAWKIDNPRNRAVLLTKPWTFWLDWYICTLIDLLWEIDQFKVAFPPKESLAFKWIGLVFTFKHLLGIKPKPLPEDDDLKNL